MAIDKEKRFTQRHIVISVTFELALINISFNSRDQSGSNVAFHGLFELFDNSLIECLLPVKPQTDVIFGIVIPDKKPFINYVVVQKVVGEWFNCIKQDLISGLRVAIYFIIKPFASQPKFSLYTLILAI